MKNDMVTHLTLEDLIDEVDDCDGRYERNRLDMIPSALDGGHALTLAKSRLNHGDWLPWLKRTKRMGQRRAQRWMKLASTGLSAEEVAERGGIVKAVAADETDDVLEDLLIVESVSRTHRQPATPLT